MEKRILSCLFRYFFPFSKYNLHVIIPPPIIESGEFKLAIPCSGPTRDSQCNPDDNCTFSFGQNSSSLNSCRLCEEGTEGRSCSKCICNGGTDSCKFRSNDRCVTCDSTPVTVAILVSVGVVVAIFFAVILFISCRLPKARQRLRRILSHTVDTGTLKVETRSILAPSSFFSLFRCCLSFFKPRHR